jgi:hypothetical protein
MLKEKVQTFLKNAVQNMSHYLLYAAIEKQKVFDQQEEYSINRHYGTRRSQ